MVGVNIEHLPPIKKCTEKVGEITEKAAAELGLAAGTAVYGGGGDASLIGVGAGAPLKTVTHIFIQVHQAGLVQYVHSRLLMPAQ